MLHYTDGGGWDLFSRLAQRPEHHKYSLICGHLYHGPTPWLSLEERRCLCFVSLHILSCPMPASYYRKFPAAWWISNQAWHLEHFSYLFRPLPRACWEIDPTGLAPQPQEHPLGPHTHLLYPEPWKLSPGGEGNGRHAVCFLGWRLSVPAHT